MTNSVEVNIDDYLSESEKKQIAIEAFRSACQARSAKDFERILSNSAYHLVSAEVDQAFDGGMAATLKANAIKVIEGLSTHTVFGAPNAWDREATKGWTHLQAAVDGASDKIKARVEEMVASYDSDALRALLEDRLVDALVAKLKA